MSYSETPVLASFQMKTQIKVKLRLINSDQTQIFIVKQLAIKHNFALHKESWDWNQTQLCVWSYIYHKVAFDLEKLHLKVAFEIKDNPLCKVAFDLYDLRLILYAKGPRPAQDYQGWSKIVFELG